MLSEATLNEIRTLIKKYPQARSALIPSLHLAQQEIGYVAPAAVKEISEIFELSPNEVYEVATFYTMLYKKPVGRNVIQVCTNISCMLRNSESLMAHLQKRLGIKAGQTTPDNKFTLLEVECLASCGTAPAVQINEDYHENLTPEKLDAILDRLD